MQIIHYVHFDNLSQIINSSDFTLVIVLALSGPPASKIPETLVKNYLCLARSPKLESLGIKTRNLHF